MKKLLLLLALPTVAFADAQKAMEAGAADALIAVYDEICLKGYGESDDAIKLSKLIQESGYRSSRDYHYANNKTYSGLADDPELKTLLDGTAGKEAMDVECLEGRKTMMKKLLEGFTRQGSR